MVTVRALRSDVGSTFSPVTLNGPLQASARPELAGCRRSPLTGDPAGKLSESLAVAGR